MYEKNSIGSLGRGGNYVKVEKIHISNAQFEGTTNGARIKTWQVVDTYKFELGFGTRKNRHITLLPVVHGTNLADWKRIRSKCDL